MVRFDLFWLSLVGMRNINQLSEELIHLIQFNFKKIFSTITIINNVQENVTNSKLSKNKRKLAKKRLIDSESILKSINQPKN